MNRATQAEPPLRHVLALSLPALPLAALTLPLYIIVPTVYAESFGVPLASVAAILFAVRIGDALTDPLIGVLADRQRPLGRRRVWFTLSAPLTAFAAFMLFHPDETAGAGHLLLWSALLSLGYTASYLSLTAWSAELSLSYLGRNRVSAVREGMVLVGTLVATAMPALATSAGLYEQTSGLGLLAWIVGVGLPLSALVAVLVVPEPIDRSAPSRAIGLRDGALAMLRNRPFVRLIIAFFINGLANGLPATLFLFFVGVGLEAPDLRGPYLLIYFLCGLIGIPIWWKLAQNRSKQSVWQLAMLMACLCFLPAPLLIGGNAWAFLPIVILTGLAVGADLFLPTSMQADVVDVDTRATGRQRTGLYFAAWALATKGALAFAGGIAFFALDLAGFDAASESQSQSALLTLGVFYAWVPIALKLLAIWVMQRFSTAMDQAPSEGV